jgi:predicted transcriptional regulator
VKSRGVSTTRRALLDILEASRLWACLYAAAKMEIPDLLKAGPRSCDALARMTGTHAPSLYRLLRALAGAGLLDEGEEQHFALTPVGSYLQRDSPDSLRPWCSCSTT